MTGAPAWADMWHVFGRIGVLSFGGPAAQIALMHRELVEERPWLDDKQFGAALSFCMLLPGPEAMQLATWCGWRMRGVAGGVLAGLLFVLPGAMVIGALVALYVSIGDVPRVEAAFTGIKAAVAIIVVQALAKIAGKVLGVPWGRSIAVAAFLAIFLFDLPFPAIIAAAGIAGWLTARHGAEPHPPSTASLAATLRTVLVWGTIWLAPIAALWAAGARFLAEVGFFFAGLAVVTFGGAYAVLGWLAQAAVTDKRWVTAEQMIDALGLAETTPGPLILVTQFVGHLAGAPAGPWMMAAAGIVTLHATFAPCFLWIFAAAPWLEALTARPALRGALGGITAAVCGVIAKLALWFAAHVLFREVRIFDAGPFQVVSPVWPTLDLAALALTALAAVLAFGLRVGLLPMLAICAVGGLLIA